MPSVRNIGEHHRRRRSADLANASWRDYGNRVGAFRIIAHAAQLGVPLTVLLNTEVYDRAPELMNAISRAGCEIVAHGITNSDSLAGMSPRDEVAYLVKTREVIARHEGRAPLGWSSPWLAQTPNTIDLLADAG